MNRLCSVTAQSDEAVQATVHSPSPFFFIHTLIIIIQEVDGSSIPTDVFSSNFLLPFLFSLSFSLFRFFSSSMPLSSAMHCVHCALYSVPFFFRRIQWWTSLFQTGSLTVNMPPQSHVTGAGKQSEWNMNWFEIARVNTERVTIDPLWRSKIQWLNSLG